MKGEKGEGEEERRRKRERSVVGQTLTARPTTLAYSCVASRHGDHVVNAICDEGQDEEEHDDDYCDHVVFLNHFEGLRGCVYV